MTAVIASMIILDKWPFNATWSKVLSLLANQLATVAEIYTLCYYRSTVLTGINYSIHTTAVYTQLQQHFPPVLCKSLLWIQVHLMLFHCEYQCECQCEYKYC